jgi:hypothetical protein
MFNLFHLSGYYYYADIALQAYCVIHCIRNNKQTWWIWFIIFVPLIGSIAYLYTEVFSRRSSSHLIRNKVDIGAVLNPGGHIKKLEANLQFTDTFANRVKLADAYLAAGQYDNAIGYYESSLKGVFADNEHVLSQLVIAYFNLERYDDAVITAQKISKLPKFAKSQAHLLYALSLEYLGRADDAEKEFKLMKGRYSCFEHRYQYGQFLRRAGRDDDADKIFADMLDEAPHLSSMERRNERTWINKAKEEFK